MGPMSNSGTSSNNRLAGVPGTNGVASSQNNAVGGNNAGKNGASGSGSGPILSNDANKLSTSIVALLVVVATAIGL